MSHWRLIRNWRTTRSTRTSGSSNFKDSKGRSNRSHSTALKVGASPKQLVKSRRNMKKHDETMTSHNTRTFPGSAHRLLKNHWWYQIHQKGTVHLHCNMCRIYTKAPGKASDLRVKSSDLTTAILYPHKWTLKLPAAWKWVENQMAPALQ